MPKVSQNVTCNSKAQQWVGSVQSQTKYLLRRGHNNASKSFLFKRKIALSPKLALGIGKLQGETSTTFVTDPTYSASGLKRQAPSFRWKTDGHRVPLSPSREGRVPARANRLDSCLRAATAWPRPEGRDAEIAKWPHTSVNLDVDCDMNCSRRSSCADQPYSDHFMTV